jgi:hypothetical protein
VERSPRQLAFTAAAVVFLLVATAIGNVWIMLVGALVLVGLGFVLVPEQRGRGLLAMAIALGVAFGVSMLMR